MRIRWRLGHHQHGLAGAHRSSELSGISSVDIGDLDAHALAGAVEKAERAGIHVALGDDVVAT